MPDRRAAPAARRARLLTPVAAACPRGSAVRARTDHGYAAAVADDAPLIRDLAYDVGLHMGEDTAFYLAKGFRVVAFEANPRLVEACEHRFQREIADGRLRIVAGAIADSAAPTVRFYRHPSQTFPETMWSSTDEAWAKEIRAVSGVEPEVVEVATINFAQTMRETGVPAYMKIDIEGGDETCLRALLDFDQRPLSLSVELSTIKDFASEFDLLERLGYDRFAFVQQATVPGSEIVTRTIDGAELRFRFEDGAAGAFGSDVGPWIDAATARAKSERLLRASRGIAPFARIWRRYGSVGKGVLMRLAALLPERAATGWHDTHAARSDALEPPVFADT